MESEITDDTLIWQVARNGPIDCGIKLLLAAEVCRLLQGPMADGLSSALASHLIGPDDAKLR